ncbi:MAG: hypothetical protein LBH42_03545 [Treponema sp.]|jgi:hypothetical protein|nr:hypothetical protein [Treponema sp.]
MIIEQTVEIPPDRRLVLDLPLELPVGMAKLELTVIPENQEISSNGKSAFGCLNHFANSAKRSEEKGAWERAVLEKHAKN